jgi:hypothetical protein
MRKHGIDLEDNPLGERLTNETSGPQRFRRVNGRKWSERHFHMEGEEQ